MVSRLIFLFILFFIQMAPAMASDELTVETNRTELYEGDTLTLTVQANIKLDFSLGDIFNPGAPQLPMPDISKLDPDFEVLSQNQKYSIRTVNGDMHGDITWVFELAPKRTGQLEIPSLSYHDQTSQPIAITVKEGTPPAQAGEPRDAFIELSTDKDRVYVQEQMVLTVKLFFTGNLLRGELSEPEHPTALIEPLGNQREYRRFRDNQEYRVVERRYAIFPQEPGELSFAPFRFEGQSRDANGKVRYLRDSQELFAIPVDAPPASFSGSTWLPASSLTLTESGLPDSLSIDPGESLTRTIKVTSTGLTSEALPPIPDQLPDGLRSYPEQPERNTETQADGLQGNLTQTAALVGVTPGEVTLPEIRIPWWDTTTDTEKVAVLPARTLTIRGTVAAQAQSSPPQAAQAPEPQDTSTSSEQHPVIATGSNRFWVWLSLGLALAWLITLGLWLRSRRVSTVKPSMNKPDNNERVAFELLISAARQGKANTPSLLLAWANVNRGDRRYHSVSALLNDLGDDALKQELDRLQSHYFGRHGKEASSSWDGTGLVETLKRLRQQDKTKGESDPGNHLPELYPQGLASRS